MREAPERPLEGPYQVEPPDHEWLRDGDRLERLVRQVSLLSVVLASFVGAYDLLDVGHSSCPVETLLECVSNQGSRCGVMSVDPSMDVFQQVLSLLGGATML